MVGGKIEVQGECLYDERVSPNAHPFLKNIRLDDDCIIQRTM